MHIIVFGASIVYGKNDKEGGWVARLKNLMNEKTNFNTKYDCCVYNCAVSGNTSQDILSRFDIEAQSRLDNWGTDNRFIISIGTNDSKFLNKENRLKIPQDQFATNIQKIIDKAKKYSSKIVFIGLIPCDESKTDPFSHDSNKSNKNEYIKKFNDIAKEICNKNKIPFLDIFDSWINSDYKKLLNDGLHPNTEGHEKIFLSVKDFLEQNKII